MTHYTFSRVAKYTIVRVRSSMAFTEGLTT
jgi:hypothetical protein